MSLCTKCTREGAKGCMHGVDVRQMEEVEMGPHEQEHMHQPQRWLQMSEDERKERREQQRLWYRRRRSQMTDQEIALQNERRRLRYRMRRLQASAEQANGAMCGKLMPGLQGGGTTANGHMVVERVKENGQGEQLRIRERSGLVNSQQIELQEWQRRQSTGEQIREDGDRQKQWRWKVAARKGSADTEAQPAHLNVMVGGASEVVDGQSDDSETTETDESLQGMLPGTCYGAVARASRPPDVDDCRTIDEATSKVPSFEGTTQTSQLNECLANRLPKRVRLTDVKRLARERHSHSGF